MNELHELTKDARYQVYQQLIGGCQHFYSKNKIQSEKVISVLNELQSLRIDDPYFLAHLTAWSVKSQESRDLRRIALYLNALSDADGTLFVEGGTKYKPNLRRVSHVLLSDFDPKELYRISYFKRLRWKMNGIEAIHFPTSLRTALTARLKSMSHYELERNVQSGFKTHIMRTYRILQTAPSEEVAQILGWPQKDGKVGIAKHVNPFSGLSDNQIAKMIVNDRMPFSRALSLLEREPTPVILRALFLVASANQLVVNYAMFEKSGLLADKKFADGFYAKMQETTSADRIETVSAKASEPQKEKASKARTAARKKEFGLLKGKLWLDIDVSVSMKTAIEIAKKYAANILDCVGEDNFEWGLVGERGILLKEKPTSVEDAQAALYGVVANHTFSALLSNFVAVQGGLEPVDYYIIITDGDINAAPRNLDVKNPTAFVIVHVGYKSNALANLLRSNGIEPVIMDEKTLETKALFAQSLKTAIAGPQQIIEEIMATSLPINV